MTCNTTEARKEMDNMQKLADDYENKRNQVLSCPFCGESEDLGIYPDEPHPEVICGNCGAMAHFDMWNKRAM